MGHPLQGPEGHKAAEGQPLLGPWSVWGCQGGHGGVHPPPSQACGVWEILGVPEEVSGGLVPPAGPVKHGDSRVRGRWGGPRQAKETGQAGKRGLQGAVQEQCSCVATAGGGSDGPTHAASTKVVADSIAIGHRRAPHQQLRCPRPHLGGSMGSGGAAFPPRQVPGPPNTPQ